MAGDDAQKLVEHGKHSNPSRTTEPWENSNHPLFLHHSDQPGAVLVSQPSLTKHGCWEPYLKKSPTVLSTAKMQELCGLNYRSDFHILTQCNCST